MSIATVIGVLARDSERLVAAIGDARIVMLGEPGHGSGAAFAAKVRLPLSGNSALGSLPAASVSMRIPKDEPEIVANPSPPFDALYLIDAMEPPTMIQERAATPGDQTANGRRGITPAVLTGWNSACRELERRRRNEPSHFP